MIRKWETHVRNAKNVEDVKLSLVHNSNAESLGDWIYVLQIEEQTILVSDLKEEISLSIQEFIDRLKEIKQALSEVHENL